MTRLLEHYREIVVPKLQEEFNYKNHLQVPRIEKIVVNMAVGKAVADSKKLTNAQNELTKLSGQKPAVCRARKSVANFKLLDRLINIALPRVRDFRGVSPKSFDGRGNYAFGVREQIIFPEISFDDVEETRGMDIIICTTAKTDAEAKALLTGFDMPFRK